MNVVQIDPIGDPRWLDFITGMPDASIFLHPAWLKVLSDTYDYNPICLAATEAHSVVGLLPLIEVRSWLTGKRAVCLPFSDACGAVVRDESVLRALLQFSEELRKGRKWKYVEIRSTVVSPGFRTTAHYKLHRKALSADPDAVLKTFNLQSKRKLKKAAKSGVVVERRTDQAALHAFIRLNALTRKKHGVPPQPDSFFRNIRGEMLDTGLGFIGVATVSDQIVAASVFLHWNSMIVYKYGASEEAGYSVGGNYAIMWDAMRWACEHGFTLLDLGRTDRTNEGLLQFKRGWGSTESDLFYTRIGAGINDRASDTPGTLARLKPAISRVPLPILKFLGRKVYGHIG